MGSTTALTGTTGKLVERITYDAYGNSTGSTRTRYGYTGRERDPTASLLYYRARFYDPQLGRFISEDPIELKGGINLYSYVKNDPLRFVDPSGLTRCNRLLGTLGGALLGGGIGGLVGEAATTVAGAVGGFAVAGPPGALLGAGAGAGAGVPLSVVTGGAGAVVGGVAGYRYCASDDVISTPKAIPTCDDRPKVTPVPPPPTPADTNNRDRHCDKLYYGVDVPTCNASTRTRGAKAGRRCHASAAQRYAACLAGQPLPPLDTWNNLSQMII